MSIDAIQRIRAKERAWYKKLVQAHLTRLGSPADIADYEELVNLSYVTGVAPCNVAEQIAEVKTDD